MILSTYEESSVFINMKNNSIQKLIHNLKYKNKNVGIFFGKELSKMLRNKNLTNDFDFIVPLPIHKKKEKERGYNQSFIIAKEIGNQLNIPVKNFILKTVTESQTKKILCKMGKSRK